MSEKRIIVIGGGPGGYVSAIKASQAGGKVTLIEKDILGGTCANRGCIPTKALLRSAEVLAMIKEAGALGLKTNGVSFDYPEIVKRKEKVVAQFVDGLKYLMRKNKIEVLNGKATLIDKRTVGIIGNQEKRAADHLIIATGSKPMNLRMDGIDGKDVLNSDDLLQMNRLPKSMIVIGGGAIGLEFAQFLAGFGCKITIIEMLSQIPPSADHEIAQVFEGLLRERGVEVFTGARVDRMKDDGSGKKVLFETKNGEMERVAEKVLIAVGREPCIDDLRLEEVGVKVEKGRIVTDQRMETTVQGIYAIGDVVGRMMLAHVAMAEGACAVNNIFGNRSEMDYRSVPSCIYTSPEIASVGLTETDAKKQYQNVKVGRFPYKANGRALISNEVSGLIKVISGGEEDEVLGIHILAPLATELIAEAVLAVQMEATVDELIQAIHAHPTFSEGMTEAALSSRKLSLHV